MPSYLGSNVQPSPGISVPMLAYIGSSDPNDGAGADDTAATFFASRDFTTGSFDARLLRQTLLFPDAISSMVRPDSTEVMFSATTSSSLANLSRCLMRSHCGFDEDEPSRENFMRMRANEP